MRKFAQLLSAMVYQNVVFIIAIGVIRVIFGNYGWWYNEAILQIVNPAYHTLLPVLIAYTGGKLVGGNRGAVVAAIATFGLTLSSDVIVIIGAMIIGPLAGWIIKKIDQTVLKRLPGVGYELLIGNVLASIVALILMLVSYLYVGNVFSSGVAFATELLDSVIYSSWLPLIAVIIEPAKVLFFNNIVNFGILAPLGIQQANEIGKSIFFLLESNPGPGLGLLLAYWLKTKSSQRKGAKMATFIHFFGGIHEVYFSYVLIKPQLICSLILGGMVGVFTFQWFDVGLVSISSPGSIFLVFGLAPKEDMLFVLLGVILSTVASFLVSLLLLRSVADSPSIKDTKETISWFYHNDKDENLHIKEESQKSTTIINHLFEEDEMEQQGKTVHNICFVCEAGIGSSAMGAAMLRKKLDQANLHMQVENSSISDVPEHVDLIICHERLLSTVKNTVPNKSYYPLRTFTDMELYNRLVEKLK